MSQMVGDAITLTKLLDEGLDVPQVRQNGVWHCPHGRCGSEQEFHV